MKRHFFKGLKYAVIFLFVSAVMGLVYGAFGFVIWQTMLFSILLVGLLVAFNSILALALSIPLFVSLIFIKRRVEVQRYLCYSLAFFLVFIPFFILLKVLPFSVF